MLKPEAEIAEKFIYMVGSIATIYTLFVFLIPGYKVKKQKELEALLERSKRQKYQNTSNSKVPEKLSFIKELAIFLRSFLVAFIIVLVSLALVYAINHFGKIETPPVSASASVSPTFTPAPTPSTAAPTDGNSSYYRLEDIDPILSKPDSFFMREWDEYHPVKVDGVQYEHCIGVCIPLKEQDRYSEENLPDEQMHSEYIEYLLSNQYSSFRFNYGIDDSSFPAGVEEEPLCHYKIVVQSCNSKEYLSSEQNILFDSDWVNYRSKVYPSTLMDVSNCEAIRITVYWKFIVRQKDPFAFNIAIINPILKINIP